MQKLVFLTNIPTPYRLAFLNTLYITLKKNDIDLFVLFCAKTESNRHWKISENEFHFPFKIMKGLHPRFKGFYPHFNPSVLFNIWRQKPAWLLIGGAWNTPTMLLASRPLWYKETKLIFWSEGHEDAVLFQNGVIPQIKKKVLLSFNAFVVPSLKSEQYLKLFLKTKKPFLRLPNTIDESFFQATNAEKKEARKKENIPEEKKVFVQVSQLEDKKGVIELTDAFLTLEPELTKQVILVIVGSGTLCTVLQKKINKSNCTHILLTGHVETKEVKKWLMIADVFILTTKFDPNPITPIEASFMKLPILLSKKAGNYDEILTGENGKAFKNVNAEAIKAVITEMIKTSKTELEKMGNISYDNARRNFMRQEACDYFTAQLKKL